MKSATSSTDEKFSLVSRVGLSSTSLSDCSAVLVGSLIGSCSREVVSGSNVCICAPPEENHGNVREDRELVEEIDEGFRAMWD